MKYLMFFLTLSCIHLCVSCSPSVYKITSRSKNEIIKDKYFRNDTVYVKNIILCNNLGFRKLWMDDIKVQSEVSDSIFNFFLNSIKQQDMPVLILSNIENHCDTILDFIFPFKTEKIDTKRIKNIAGIMDNENAIILLPIIHIDNVTQRAVMVSSRGIPDGGYFMRDIFLKIAIYLIKNNEIIYLKSARYGPVSSETATYDEEPPKKLEQKHWDNLVRLVMNDYIRRLE